MKTTPKDVPYCGVSKSAIDAARPVLYREALNDFVTFIVKRYLIHVAKDVYGQRPPFTNDPVLSKYRFTNVRREHDRQTIHLINAVSHNPSLSMRDKIVNTFMFRAWNNAETFAFFGFPHVYRRITDPSLELKEQARRLYRQLKRDDPEAFESRRWWSAAYNQGGTKSAWKFPDGEGIGRAHNERKAAKFPDWEADIPLRPFHIGPWLRKLDIVDRILDAGDQQEVFEIIKEVRGFSDFLGYQVYVDLTYINNPEAGDVFSFSENEFTVAGPGCKKGLAYLFKDSSGMTSAEQVFWLRDNMPKILHKRGYDLNDIMLDLPEEDRCMNVMSLENCLCEISKYIRAVRGEGRPKVTYSPHEGRR